MTANAETCIKALRALAQDIQSEDGVANAALSECADRMEQMQVRIHQLETENDALRADLLLWYLRR
jgi:uncharacterized protein Yka (UPF0111/DUF47 family)